MDFINHTGPSALLFEPQIFHEPERVCLPRGPQSPDAAVSHRRVQVRDEVSHRRLLPEDLPSSP